MNTSRQGPWLAATILIVLVGTIYNFDGYPLLEPDEGRNAEVAREMAETNDYLLPRLNGLPYIDKPVLYFGVGALAMELLGPTVLAARLPSLLFTVATLVLVAWFARRVFDAAAAWTAAVATAATPFMLAYARTVIFDSALTFWVTLAVIAFYLSVEEGERFRPVAWAAIALGVLTKGPVAIALPLMITVPYALWRRRARGLVDPIAVLLCLAILLPWVYGMAREVPGFLEHALVTETARRLTTTELQRTGPFWYFLAILPAAALPWSLVVIGGGWSMWRARSQVDHKTVLLLLWVLIPLIFFSLSQSKRPQYALPLVPPVGLLVGTLWIDARGRFPGVRLAAAATGVFGMLLLTVRFRISQWVPGTTEVAAEIPLTALVLGITCIAAGVGAWLGAAHRGAALMALSLPVAVIPFASTGLMAAIGNDRSGEALAAAITAAAGPSAQVVGVEAFPTSLPFYLRRTMVLSTADGSELTSNYLTRDIDLWRRVPGTPLRHADWWREAVTSCTTRRVFVVQTTDMAAMTFIGNALPLIMASRRYAAFGPCGAGRLASLPTRPVVSRASKAGRPR